MRGSPFEILRHITSTIGLKLKVITKAGLQSANPQKVSVRSKKSPGKLLYFLLQLDIIREAANGLGTNKPDTIPS